MILPNITVVFVGQQPSTITWQLDRASFIVKAPKLARVWPIISDSPDFPRVCCLMVVPSVEVMLEHMVVMSEHACGRPSLLQTKLLFLLCLAGKAQTMVVARRAVKIMAVRMLVDGVLQMGCSVSGTMQHH